MTPVWCVVCLDRIGTAVGSHCICHPSLLRKEEKERRLNERCQLVLIVINTVDSAKAFTRPGLCLCLCENVLLLQQQSNGIHLSMNGPGRLFTVGPYSFLRHQFSQKMPERLSHLRLLRVLKALINLETNS